MTKTAVIGTGYWGKNLVRVFYRLPGSELKYICDADSRNLEAVGKNYPGVKLTGDYREVLADREVEALAIATPAVSHYELARESLQAGKHTFVEKPLTLEVGHAEKLVELAVKADRLLMTGHLMVYHPAVEVLKQMVDSDELGRVYYIYAQRVNLGVVRRDENALWSLAPHDISIVLYLLGRTPVEVAARGGCYIRKEIEDVVFLVMRFAGGEMAHVQLSWLDPHKERKITMVGSRKMVVFDDMQASEKIKVFDKGVNPSNEYSSYTELLGLREGDILIPQLKMEEPLGVECSTFLACAAGQGPCRSSGQDGLAVVRVLDAAGRSLADGGKPVKIT
ncbi:MAG: Gfo/Idh/MocA family oxidoreductase [Candidatus Glassbacteria bacterium]|nr:Gfo/Idh/MocA family oxidoreductase [Candidatus Glassbacteria bacterium]